MRADHRPRAHLSSSWTATTLSRKPIVVLRRPRVSLLGVAWIVVGLIVAANRGYLAHLNTIGHILSAVLAVVLWPLILLGVHVAI